MNFKQIYPKIYQVTTEDLPKLGKIFCRLQEFYESPNPKYKGQVFDLNEFLGWFKEEYEVEYLTQWEGYNLPSVVIRQWVNLCHSSVTPDFSEEEFWLLDHLDKINPNEDFYLIGTLEGDKQTLDHELTHALFNLSPHYKRIVTGCFQEGNYPCHPQDLRILAEHLRELGYCEEVLLDEMNAYLMHDSNYLSENKIWSPSFSILSKILNNYFIIFLTSWQLKHSYMDDNQFPWNQKQMKKDVDV